MSLNTQLEKAQKVAGVNETDIYFIKTEKFKTETISIFFQDKLDKDSVSYNALFPNVLKRGCRKYPTLREISSKLDDMYGASLYCDIGKKGESHIVHFFIDYVSNKYLGGDNNNFKDACTILFDVICDPVTENGAFNSEYVRQEKVNLASIIESRINDKMAYSQERCYEEMCKDEPFGIYEYGKKEDVERIQPLELYQHYKKVLISTKKYIFITGETYEDKIDLIKTIMTEKFPESKAVTIFTEYKCKSFNGTVANIDEFMDVNQGKLCVGFRSGIKANDKDYYALLMYNSILGGGGFVNSKLFINVREKESLAYYIFSNLEKYKGIMMISSGIDASNKQKTLDIIAEQMETMKKGNISDFEMEYTKATIIYSLKSISDGQLRLTDYYFSQIAGGTNDDFDTFTEKLKKVTKEDVIKVAAKMKLDTIYFLGPKTDVKEEAKDE